MTVPSQDMSKTSPPPHAEPATDTVAREVVPSARLLGSHNTLVIDHQGTEYVLRATRTGKLILTK